MNLFSKPKSVKPPPIPAPPAVPEVGEDVGDEAARRARRRKGFGQTIVTGDLAPQTGKKSLLG